MSAAPGRPGKRARAAASIAGALAAVVVAALGLALAFAAWLQPQGVMGWLAVLAWCG